jgi:hypothetical protein
MKEKEEKRAQRRRFSLNEHHNFYLKLGPEMKPQSPSNEMRKRPQ